jgi:hypothetical protein
MTAREVRAAKRGPQGAHVPESVRLKFRSVYMQGVGHLRSGRLVRPDAARHAPWRHAGAATVRGAHQRGTAAVS